MTDTVTDTDTGSTAAGAPGMLEQQAFRAMRWIARMSAYDIATAVLIAALAIAALSTFKDYGISNDEGVQHQYGELIIAYYRSGFADQRLFSFDNLYLYGGLFDVVAVGLSHLLPMDPYDLRHILCALIGISGVGATAATARLIAGPRAGFIAAIGLSVCGAWYGTMFNHTKDIPLATAMMGGTFFLIRISRTLPAPRWSDVVALGLCTGAALGMRVLGLLLVVYGTIAIVLYMPRPLLGHRLSHWRSHGQNPGGERLGFIVASSLRLLPALALAYAIMIVTWPWSALAPLNPIRGLFAFSEFQYHIDTVLAGHVYEMASVPRLYVPIYILIRVPLLTLFGAALAMIFAAWPRLTAATSPLPRKDVALVALTVMFPLTCQVICHGPAFTGLRHFLFVIPSLAVLAGVGLDTAVTALDGQRRAVAALALAVITATCLWNAVTLVRLHPYEYLFYNPVVGGLEGASRRYDTDYWVNIMPAAIDQLEDYINRTENTGGKRTKHNYTVAVCGDRLSFEHEAKERLLQWTWMKQWREADFFIAPTHMNCDRALDGKVIVTIQRLGVPIGVVKDRRGLNRTAAAEH